MKFVFFPVLENGENGLGDEGVDGAMPPPQNFWARSLEPPLRRKRQARSRHNISVRRKDKHSICADHENQTSETRMHARGPATNVQPFFYLADLTKVTLGP